MNTISFLKIKILKAISKSVFKREISCILKCVQGIDIGLFVRLIQIIIWHPLS